MKNLIFALFLLIGFSVQAQILEVKGDTILIIDNQEIIQVDSAAMEYLIGIQSETVEYLESNNPKNQKRINAEKSRLKKYIGFRNKLWATKKQFYHKLSKSKK